MAKPEALDIKWTLVQHSGFTYGGKPGFRRGVELVSVTARDAARITNAGGKLYETYSDGRDAEMGENYPPGVDGLYPQVRGTFSRTKLNGSPVYIPAPEPATSGSPS